MTEGSAIEDRSLSAPSRSLLLLLALGGWWGCGPPPDRHATAEPPLPRALCPRLFDSEWRLCDEPRPGEDVSAGGSPKRARPGSKPTDRKLEVGTQPPALGAGALLLADPERVSAVIHQLEDLRQSQPKPPAELLNDLGAAYMMQAESADQPSDLVRALDLVARAVALAPHLPQASFNRGLLCDALSLSSCSRESWEAYLRLDPGSRESEEARARLHHLARPSAAERWAAAKSELGRGDALPAPERVRELVSPFRAAAKQLVEEELLPKCAEAVEQGRLLDADALLARAGRIAEELAALTGDRLPRDVVERFEEATKGPSDRRRTALLAGHRAYVRATGRLAEDDYSTAEAEFQSARDSLLQGGSPMHLRAGLGHAHCAFLRHRPLAALAEASSLESQAEELSYGSVEARAHWLRGLAQMTLSRPLDSLDSYLAALERYQRLGDEESAASIHARLAERFLRLGKPDLAWRHRLSALAGLPLVREPRYRSGILGEAAAAVPGSPTAELVEESRFAAIREGGNPYDLANALCTRAVDDLESRQVERSRRHLSTATRAAEKVEEPELRLPLEICLSEVKGRLAMSADPGLALTFFQRALDLLEQVQYPVYRARLLLLAAGALRKLARPAEAARALEAAVSAVEEEWRRTLAQRRRGEHEDLWPRYFAQQTAPFAELVELLAGEERAEDALTYQERLQGRELLDLVGDLQPSLSAVGGFLRVPEEPLTGAQIRRRTAAGTVLVVYALRGDRLLIWTVRRTGTRLFAHPVDRGELDAQLAGFHQAISRQDPADETAIEAFLTAFDRLLIEPIREHLEPREHLVFVPDPALQGMPFAALRDRRTRSFLIEHHSVTVAPSATLYAFAQQRDVGFGREERPSILVVASPAFDRSRFPGLEPLRGAAAEGEEVARLYPDAITLTGAEATKEAFLQEIGRHTVIHFAGHAVSQAAGSYLVLAPSAASTGEIYAQEFLGLDLGRARIIVLSACSSAAGGDLGAQGVSHLVRPLLGAGIPAVLGSLWEVPDQSTVELLRAFHENLRQGASAAEALRSAQLLELRSPNDRRRSPRVWASFELIGAASLGGPSSRREQ